MKSKFKLYKTLYGFFAGSKTGGIFPPFFSDLLTWHKGIFNSSWLERINTPGLDGTILPRLAGFNGIDDKIVFSSSINLGTSHTIGCTIIYNDVLSQLLCNGIGNDNWIYIAHAGSIRYKASNAEVLLTPSSNLLDNTLYKIEIIRVNTSVQLYINDVLNDTKVLASNPNFILDGISDLTSLFLASKYISLICKNSIGEETFKMYPTGQGGFDYDLVSGVIYGTWSGSGTRFDYDARGSLYPKLNGYSLWQKTGSPDIQVLFDINGNALVLTPGTNIETGYEEKRNQYGSVQYFNMFDCLVDFDPNDTLDAILDNFDRSNTTIYNATARAGTDYDSGNPYRFQINNLDPRILFDFRNVDYKGMLFAKILLDANDNLIRIDEMLSYLTDKIDANEYQVYLYCGYLAIIVLDGNGDYITDVNGYIIIESL